MQNKAKKLRGQITRIEQLTDSLKVKSDSLNILNDSLTIENERYKRLLNIESQFLPLVESGYFCYLEECKKFVIKDLTSIEIFEPLQVDIKQEYVDKILEVGHYLNKFLDTLNKNNKDVTYLLVIEGNMANRYDMSINANSTWGYKTSYERSLAVFNFWLENGIILRKQNIEVLLCGSGFNGLCRDDVEENNKRFSIQIIPKVKKE